MVMSLLGQPAGLRLDRALEAEVIGGVIDVLNREFQGELRREARRLAVADRARALVVQQLRGRGVSPTAGELDEVVEDILRRVTGLGFLDLLLPPARTDLSEIAIYSHGLVQVMKKGAVRWESLDLQVPSAEVFRVFGMLAGAQSKALNEATPIVYARLPATPDNPGGGRITLVHPVLSAGEYPAVNVRLFEQRPVRPEWVVAQGTLSAEMMDFLGDEVRAGARLLICGETRSGKTTLLSALTNLLPPHWRIVKIEDPAEIWIDRPTVQTFEARAVPPGAETASVTLADLVTLAMRTSPDYLIVGEVRDGHAAQAMLSALMSGTSGCCTLHARSPEHAFERLATLMGIAERIGEQDASKAMAESIDCIVQIQILQDVRRVTSIVRVERELQGGRPVCIPLFRFDEASPLEAPRWVRLPETASRPRSRGGRSR